MMGNFSCGNSTDNGKVLAQVGDKYLYASDLIGFDFSGDSVAIVKKYTTNWINNQILNQHASENSKASDEEINKQVEKFKLDLQLAAYEKEFLSKNLDTAISTQDIQKYYNSNKALFELRDYVLSVFYMKFDISEKNNSTISNEIKNCKSFQDAKRVETKYAEQSVNSFLEPETWIFLSDLLREIPIAIDDKSKFLENNSFYETKTDEDIYFVRIFDYKLKNETSPINLVEGKIRTMILRERSQNLIEANRNKIIKQFNEKNEVQDYTK